MIDFSAVKSVSIPEGVVTKIVSAGRTLWQTVTFKNWVPVSVDTDGSIYNGTGYMEGYRMNSSGGIAALAGAIHCGYIPMAPGNILRAAGSTAEVSKGGQYITFYKSDFTRIATYTFTNAVAQLGATYSAMGNGCNMLTLDTTGKTAISAAAYFRISMALCSAENFIVTINEEI